MIWLLLALGAQHPLRCPSADVYCKEMSSIVANARVRHAVSFIEQSDAAALSELISLTQIAAPPFHEAERARRYGEMLRAAGADSVDFDSAGNVIALRRGLRRLRTVVVAGHMDTVFPEGTDVTVRQHGDTLLAPGVGDNTRGMIVLLQVLRSLVHANIRTQSDILIVGTVGEEGLGDLRGARQLFRDNRPIDSFIAVDGGSDESVINTAIGSKRYHVSIAGAGGHSWGSFGSANPIHALARAISLFDDAASRFTASGPPTSYNVGRIRGGTSVNAIPEEAWAEFDLRSENAARLESLDSIFHASVTNALKEQNEQRTSGPELRLNVQLVGDRPSGVTASNTAIVQRALAATRALGLTPLLDESSTDANIAISRGTPAITLGSGGISGNSHAIDEWWINSNGTRGIRRILFTLLAEAALR